MHACDFLFLWSEQICDDPTWHGGTRLHKQNRQLRAEAAEAVCNTSGWAEMSRHASSLAASEGDCSSPDCRWVNLSFLWRKKKWPLFDSWMSVITRWFFEGFSASRNRRSVTPQKIWSKPNKDLSNFQELRSRITPRLKQMKNKAWSNWQWSVGVTFKISSQAITWLITCLLWAGITN